MSVTTQIPATTIAQVTIAKLVTPVIEGNRSAQRMADHATELAQNFDMEADFDFHRDSIREWKGAAERYVAQDLRQGWDVVVAHCQACIDAMDAYEAKYQARMASRLKSAKVVALRMAGVAHDWEREVNRALAVGGQRCIDRLDQLNHIAETNVRQEMEDNQDPEAAKDSSANLWAYIVEFVHAAQDFLDQEGRADFEVTCTECGNGKVTTVWPRDSRHYCAACVEDQEARLASRMDA